MRVNHGSLLLIAEKMDMSDSSQREIIILLMTEGCMQRASYGWRRRMLLAEQKRKFLFRIFSYLSSPGHLFSSLASFL